MKKIPIFYYHSIGGPQPETLALRHFQRHLDLLTKYDITTATFSDLVQKKLNPEKKYAVLTFDDGLLDNYDVAFPELQKRGMTATFFCVPGYDTQLRWVNPSNRKWTDTPLPGYTVEYKSMSKTHRADLLKYKMEIGSHTMTHRKLTHIPKAELHHEIAGSKRTLESELGQPVQTFCFPNGRFNRHILAEVKRAGYKGAASTIPGYTSPHKTSQLYHRFLIENPDIFEQVLLGKAFYPKTLINGLKSRLKR